jgi:opacity protein-like surface antigen
VFSKFYQKSIITISLALAMPAFAEQALEEQELSETQVEIYQTKATNSSWEEKDIDPSFYDSPYQVSLFSSANGEDSERLLSQTYSIFGLGLGVVGVLAVMPSSITHWESSDEGLAEKWVNNVKEGPVWDRDDVILNYVMHPYFGGVYYQSARKSGYRQWDAFLYSTVMSTFFWEYGVEAFAEVPSLQDLVVTPVLGWAYGEWAYTTERDIWVDGGTVLGSEYLGNTALFFLDPVDSLGRNFNYLFGKDVIKAGTGYFTFNEVALPYGNETENQVGLKISYIFGEDDSPALPGISGKRVVQSRYENRTQDPVNTGIIGISAGAIMVNLDSEWGKESAWGYQWSLGLYFTPSFSTRLNYSRAIVDDKNAGDSIIYENYGIDGQYYFNSDEDLRPFITAGLGEVMSDEDDDQKRFQMNAGAGLHYKINNNWAIQTDWRHYYSTRTETQEDQFGTAIIYRFGEGEQGL